MMRRLALHAITFAATWGLRAAGWMMLWAVLFWWQWYALYLGMLWPWR